jgi:hypothetical protein
MVMPMSKRVDLRWPAIALIAISVLMGLRPGDSPWFFDMPRDFNLAIQFNSTPTHIAGITIPFTPSPYGLKGTHGIRYGPLAIWLDQIMLGMTSDPITMTAVRTILFALMTGFSLLWMSRILNVTPWLAVVTMLSPWIYYYTRELWDNSVSMPFCALSFVAYGDFLARKRAWSLCLAFLATALMTLVHVTSAPFIAAMVLHLVIFEFRWVIKFFWPLATTIAILMLISMPWLHYFLAFHGAGVPEYASRWHGWVFPLFGAQHITAWNLGYFLEFSWRHIHPAALRYGFTIARGISLIGFVACWIGLIMTMPWVRDAIRRPAGASPVAHICLVGWGTFVFQILFDGIEHVSGHPHYNNSTWIVYVMFAWLALDAIPKWLGSQNIVGRLVLPVYAASLLFSTLVVAYEIVHNGGSRGDRYSAVLSNQLEVAREIAQYSEASPIELRVPYMVARPDAAAETFELVRNASGELPVRRIVVQYRDAFPDDARIIVKTYPLNSADQSETQPERAATRPAAFSTEPLEHE